MLIYMLIHLFIYPSINEIVPLDPNPIQFLNLYPFLTALIS